MKRKFFVPLLAAVLSLGVSAAFGQSDSQLQASAQKALNGSKMKNVQVSVQNGVATLSGSVDVFDLKEQADHKIHRIKGIKAVENDIQIAGPEVSDQELHQKLLRAIEYDRVGYGTTAFNAIGVSVSNGVVTLSGHAYGPVDADSAVAVASNTKGVKDVVNDIQVDPVSPMDDRTRIAVFRSVYGFPSLNKYAMDPGKPIRISVQNGNVTLYGEVDSQADKDAAGIRANSVPGVFHVSNQLNVAGNQPEKK
ncbi:BON domain-containing protein [Paracidobacterium acidisoli]|uniref:BON domain-containing protein n=1 Tax=Paracidobacterium acidisoli TaxID=2303751 RepID=A0A372IUV5_9BACT|nr:BON domain-containing protein [Paracidobacterium acidisoli]MBT9329842.1 BON domain-containing protein [Paracidobacterium acidisoli]